MTDEPLHRAQADLHAAAVAYAEAEDAHYEQWVTGDTPTSVVMSAWQSAGNTLTAAAKSYRDARREAGL